MNKTIKEMSKLDGKVYVHLTNDERGNAFLNQAEAEGFTFGDGAKPTSRPYAELMAVHPDNTISYVGIAGRIAFGTGAEHIGEQKINRIEF